MKSGQWSGVRYQDGIDGIARREVRDREPDQASTVPAVRADAVARTVRSDNDPQVFVVWQLLQSLRAAVQAVAASDELALVRSWCVQALEDLAPGTREREARPALTTEAKQGGGRGGYALAAAKSALTAQQVEILRHLRAGERPKEIARALHITDSTARSHIRDIIERLEVHGTPAAVSEAERRGLLGPPAT